MNLDELYFKNNFTKEDNKTNLEVNKLTLECLESKNNTFKLDEMGNLRVNSISVNNENTQIDLIYPIGSIYMNTTSVNPNTLFGGTWEQIKDRFLLAAGDLYPNGAIGGEATHRLTKPEIGNVDFGIVCASGAHSGVHAHTDIMEPHNNMPPYLTVYIWKRVA